MLLKLFILTIIDFLLIWLWIYSSPPDPSVSIALVIFIPLVIAINLFIALTLTLLKRRFANLFVINSLISAVLMYFIFIAGINKHQKNRLESWEFHRADTTFRITHLKKENTFTLSYSTSPGSSTSFLYGKFSYDNINVFLVSDSTKYLLRNGYLFGFRNDKDSIPLKKI